MSRVQLALNVDDLEESVAFYSKLFNTAPAKLKEGYANFAIAEPPLKLVLLQNPGKGGTINHLGVEVESSEQVRGEIARLSGEGLFTDEEMGTTCCFATQDKVWVSGPAGEKWEVYTVIADSDTFGASPSTMTIRTAKAASAAVPPQPTQRNPPQPRPAAEKRFALPRPGFHGRGKRIIVGWKSTCDSSTAAPTCRSFGGGWRMPLRTAA
jgi:catechol 2,3-dioxygenase-like lactoylglutathione lyase family enzyme